MTKPFFTKDNLSCAMCAYQLTVIDDSFGVTVRLCMHPQKQKILKDQKPCKFFVLLFDEEGRDEG